jgi:intergrase/recombinase
MAETTNEAVEFTPEQQAKVDEIVKSRVARERERWEKQTDVEHLKQQLEAKDAEISAIKREHYFASARRAVVGELAAKGVTDEGRVHRVLRHVDLEAIEPDENGQPNRLGVQEQLAAVGRDMPELLTYRVGAGSGAAGSRSSRLRSP